MTTSLSVEENQPYELRSYWLISRHSLVNGHEDFEGNCHFHLYSRSYFYPEDSGSRFRCNCLGNLLIKYDELGGTCGRHKKDKKCIQNF
jgi:hypothetical protein